MSDNKLFSDNPVGLVDASSYMKFKIVVDIYLHIDAIEYFTRDELLKPIHKLIDLACLKPYSVKLIGESPSDSLSKYSIDILDPNQTVKFDDVYEEKIMQVLNDIKSYIQTNIKLTSEQLASLTIGYTKDVDMIKYLYSPDTKTFDLAYSELDYLEEVGNERERIIDEL